MPDFRTVTDSFSVSPQITEADVRAAAEAGFTMIVNNRPDREDVGQTPGDRIAAAANAAGLAYHHLPVVGRPAPEQVAALRTLLEDAGPGARILAYCRSGTRSITTWALGQPPEDRDDVVRRARAAGYDLGAVLPR